MIYAISLLPLCHCPVDPHTWNKTGEDTQISQCHICCQVFNFLSQLSSCIGGILCPFYCCCFRRGQSGLTVLIAPTSFSVLKVACAVDEQRCFRCDVLLDKRDVFITRQNFVVCLEPQGSKQFLPTSLMQWCGFFSVCNKLLFSQH